ncbi:MAG: exo-alpha-sialidase [Clostridia bacterium]|nr:exo-alpha-sialidase [Clostridia bacterium]
MVLEKNRKGYFACRIPALVRTAAGVLVAAYECRRGSDSDWADIDIKVQCSENDGESWETIALICGEGKTLNNPVLFADGSRVLLLFCENYREIFLAESVDGGRSFGAPQAVAVRGADFFWNARAIGPGHGIFHGGRLIVPIWFAYNREDAHAHRPSLVGTLYSEDGGESWCVGELPDGAELVNPSESALAVDADGRVVMSVRNENEERMRAIACSSDGVSGWEKPRLCERLPDPVCQGSMVAVGGVLYHVNCENRTVREGLTVKASRDGFATVCRTIPVDGVGGYADIAASDTELFVLYERGVLAEDGELRFVKIPL